MGPNRSQARRTALPLALLAAAAIAAAPPQTGAPQTGAPQTGAPQAGAPGAGAPRAGESGVTAQGVVTVDPGSVRAGGHVELRVNVCDGGTAVAHADAFESDVELRPEAGGGLVGRATVWGDAQTGSYTVTADCEGRPESARGSFTVVAGDVPASPSAPVRAGGGGMAGESSGDGGFTAGGGGVLGLAAAAAIGAAVLRRRRPVASDGSGDV